MSDQRVEGIEAANQGANYDGKTKITRLKWLLNKGG
jgi:hypothetical protein